MSLLSFAKSLLLSGADAFNATIGGPQPFTRAPEPDPSAAFRDDMTRRTAIAVGAERELEAFVRDGSFFCMRPNDLGDAAIWQGVYLAMTAVRWGVEPSIDRAKSMRAAATATARYLDGGILYRGAVPRSLEGECFHRDPTKGYFDVGGWVYRDDASLDSLLGVMLGAAFVMRFGDEVSRSILCEPLKIFAARFKADGYRLVRRDGTPTTYGDCRPGVFQAPVRVLAAALPSLVAGTPDWRAIATAYAPEFSTTDTQVPGRISYVNAHLAMLANVAFVAAVPTRTSFKAPGHAEAEDGLRRLVAKYADAGNSFVVMAARALGVSVPQSARDKAAKVLVEFPVGPKPKTGR
jgi:hypothetical protein